MNNDCDTRICDDARHVCGEGGYQYLYVVPHGVVKQPRGQRVCHMGSFPHPRHIFAAARENKDLRSPFRGPSSLLTNIFCADP